MADTQTDAQAKQSAVNARLLDLAAAGDADGIEALLREGPEIYYQEPETGWCLMVGSCLVADCTLVFSRRARRGTL
jgi:hypothetical protein